MKFSTKFNLHLLGLYARALPVFLVLQFKPTKDGESVFAHTKVASNPTSAIKLGTYSGYDADRVPTSARMFGATGNLGLLLRYCCAIVAALNFC